MNSINYGDDGDDAGIKLSKDPDVMLDQVKTKWKLILTSYAGVAAALLVGLLLAVLVPAAGLFVFCCRCAGIVIISLIIISIIITVIFYCIAIQKLMWRLICKFFSLFHQTAIICY